jgi:hypothetical protein
MLLPLLLNNVQSGGTPTLSSGSPTGLIGTSTSVVLGAVTNTANGTFYGVVDVTAKITGITAAQIKAGQNNASAAAIGASNSAISTTSPSTTVSGLTAATAYSWAMIQRTSGAVDTNLLTGTFTTASSAAGFSGMSNLMKIVNVYVVSATGRTKWKDYIPVKQVTPGATSVNTFNQDGAIAVVMLGSNAGLVEGKDYIPVVEVVDPDVGRWRTDNTGFIPIIAL